MELNFDAILRPIFEKYRDYFASEEVLDTHQNYEMGKLSYFVSAPKRTDVVLDSASIKIWNPIAPLPLQIEQEMKDLLISAFGSK